MGHATSKSRPGFAFTVMVCCEEIPTYEVGARAVTGRIAHTILEDDAETGAHRIADVGFRLFQRIPFGDAARKFQTFGHKDLLFRDFPEDEREGHIRRAGFTLDKLFDLGSSGSLRHS